MGNQTERFSIAKDLKEWIDIDDITPWGELIGSDERTWKYGYSGKSEFSPFMNVYDAEVETFRKYYPDMDIWLKNIYWDSLFESAQKILNQAFGKIKSPESLIVIHASPLEIAIAGEFLKSHGLFNLVYNFNRIPTVNSTSKTLEAILFLVSWDKIDWLKERVSKMEVIKNDISLFKNSFFLFDENDITPSWNISRIDPYVKSAIGWKENVITYRLNELPEKDFLIQNGVKNIYFFDTDESNAIDSFYKKNLGPSFNFSSFTISSAISEKIGYFEDYVCEKNREYLSYKKDILDKNNTLSGTLLGGGGTEKWKKNYSSSNSSKDGSTTSISLKEGLVYLGGLAVILPLFLLLEVSGGQSVFTKNASGNWIYNGSSSSSSIRGTSGSWGSSFTKSASSSSSVSSFGGGGFSKGGG